MAAPTKNTAFNNFMFFLSLSNGSPATGITQLTSTYSQDAGAFVNVGVVPIGSGQPIWEVGNGWYATNFSASLLNCNTLVYYLSPAAGGSFVPTHIKIVTL